MFDSPINNIYLIVWLVKMFVMWLNAALTAVSQSYVRWCVTRRCPSVITESNSATGKYFNLLFTGGLVLLQVLLQLHGAFSLRAVGAERGGAGRGAERRAAGMEAPQTGTRRSNGGGAEGAAATGEPALLGLECGFKKLLGNCREPGIKHLNPVNGWWERRASWVPVNYDHVGSQWGDESRTPVPKNKYRQQVPPLHDSYWWKWGRVDVQRRFMTPSVLLLENQTVSQVMI